MNSEFIELKKTQTEFNSILDYSCLVNLNSIKVDACDFIHLEKSRIKYLTIIF